MRQIKAISAWSYCLSFQQSCVLSASTLNSRKGLIVKVVDDLGQIGIGEISPFLGLHHETLEDCITQLRVFSQSNFTIDISTLYPSVQFGLSMAFVQFDQDNHTARVKFNGLLTRGMNFSEINHHPYIQQLMLDGVRCFKIKIGNNEWDQLTHFFDHQKIPYFCRVDANRDWQFSEALTFFQHNFDFSSTNLIDYLEEPFVSFSDNMRFYQRTGISWAVDEQLIDVLNGSGEDWSLWTKNGLKALVIKPETLGHIDKTISAICLAKKYNVETVISNSFLSDVALTFLISFTAKHVSPETISGLGTFRLYKARLTDIDWSVENGHVETSCKPISQSNLHMNQLIHVVL